VLQEKVVMGNIKTRTIKRMAAQLVKSYPELFSKDFSENKKIVNQIVQADSQATINKVAGYITRLLRRKEHQESVMEV
jgi:small subunit ribosomal protein S17e